MVFFLATHGRFQLFLSDHLMLQEIFPEKFPKHHSMTPLRIGHGQTRHLLHLHWFFVSGGGIKRLMHVVPFISEVSMQILQFMASAISLAE